nr:SCP2 sterol-binding domain-containing protein [Candidatus Sigynarchaeota archaeon]
MLIIEEPEDLISRFIFNLFKHSEDNPEFTKLVVGWNKIIVLDVKDFYPVTIVFSGDRISFKIGEAGKANLKINTDLNTVCDMVYRRLHPVKAVLAGRMKVKGLWKLGTLSKFYKMLFGSIERVVDSPQQRYYEDKGTT